MAGDAVTVISTDVFDTLVWRKLPEPVDAFPVLGARLAERGLIAAHISPSTFAQVRVAAEARARAARSAAGGGVEVDLAEIYAAVPLHLWAPGASTEDAQKIEVEVEKELLLPDLDMVQLLDAARERNKRIVAVSDTYFSADQLAALLDMELLREIPLERIFTSSTHRVNKGGGLFDVVLRELGVEPSEVLHIGDNEVSDVQAPRRIGIQTVYVERRPPALGTVMHRENPYIPSRVVGRHGDYALSALRAKILHRTAVGELPAELQPFWRYGAASLGPVFTGFAEWIQHRASQVGVSKVFCLMREGAVLAQLVNVAGAYLDSSVDAEPAWLSRQVCARASIRDASRDELAALLNRRQLPSVAEFCSTLGVRVEDLPAFAGRMRARLGDRALAAELLDALSSDPARRLEIVAASTALRDRVVRYVRSVVPPGESVMVLVDLGWAGSIQSMLQRILREEGVPIETLGLYLVTHAGALDRVMEGTDIAAFLVDNGVPPPAAFSIIRSPEILEQVCMPDFGSQIGLTAELEPVLAGPGVDADRVQGAERDAVQKGVFAFQREWARYATFLPGRLSRLHEGAQPILLGMLARSIVAPTEDEARIFSSWVHDENYGSAAAEPIVGSSILRALRHLDPAALTELPMGELYWPFGLAALHDEHLARSAGLVAMGQLSWEATSSRVECGNFEIYFDDGFGYSELRKKALQPRRNRFGLSYVAATLSSREIRRVRLDPATAPCVIRIDWVSFRCWRRGAPGPVEIVLDQAEDLARLGLTNCSWLRPKLLLVDHHDPQLTFPVEDILGGAVYEVHVQCGFAVLATAPNSPSRVGKQAVLHTLRPAARLVRALESRTGLPFEAALLRLLPRLRALGG